MGCKCRRDSSDELALAAFEQMSAGVEDKAMNKEQVQSTPGAMLCKAFFRDSGLEKLTCTHHCARNLLSALSPLS